MAATIDRFHGEHRFLSNFYPNSFTWHGHIWATSEHAYQAAKTDDPEWRERIRRAYSPGEAKRIGRKAPMIPKWDDVKLDVMREILEIKFAPGRPERRLLEATGDTMLVEGNTWGDQFWGVCDGVGENHLGHILMEIRDTGGA